MPVIFNLDKCDGCGICDNICPGDVIYMHRPKMMPVEKGLGKMHKVNPYRLGFTSYPEKKSPFLPRPQECWHCGSCRQDCPQEAITVVFPPDMLSM
ncbi:MAG: 4Fe-4S dicluster domain-containing protein [Rhodospirillales bacterium]|nr:4Fe-4S dicluster domain-containing protein [Rhodospirillales bacterium]